MNCSGPALERLMLARPPSTESEAFRTQTYTAKVYSDDLALELIASQALALEPMWWLSRRPHLLTQIWAPEGTMARTSSPPHPDQAEFLVRRSIHISRLVNSSATDPSREMINSLLISKDCQLQVARSGNAFVTHTLIQGRRNKGSLSPEQSN
jgi:hypothetical protein